MKVSVARFYILTIALIYSLSTQLKAQEIAFEVIDEKTQAPLDSVLVFDNSGQPLTLILQGRGNWNTHQLGFLDLRFERSGYASVLVNHVHLIPQKSVVVRVQMTSLSEQIDAVEIISHQFESNPDNPVSSFYFNREEINMNPGAQGDIFRAISMLPGVSSSGGVYSAIAVRGQGVRDNVYMVDGIPVTELGHLEGNSFFNDPNGGRFSIFAPRVIEGAEFQSGGFSALYGRRSASYLGLTVKEGNTQNLIIDGQMDLLGVNVNVEGPIKKLKNTRFFFSARYQNFLALVNVIGLKDIGLPRYADFILKTNTTINPKLSLQSLWIAAPERYTRDTGHVNADRNLNLVYMPDFQRNKLIGGISLHYQPNSAVRWSNIAYYTGYYSDIRVDKAIPDTDSIGQRRSYRLSILERLQEQTYREQKWGLRSLWEIKAHRSLAISAGIESDYTALYNQRLQNGNDTQYIYYRGQAIGGQNYLVLFPEFVNSERQVQGFNHSAYVEARQQIGRSIQLNLGYRTDYTGFSAQWVGAPRLSASWKWNARQSLGISMGRYYQDPVYSDIADQRDGHRLRMEQTDMWVLSFRQQLGSTWRFRAEFWQKWFSDMAVRPQQGYTFIRNGGSGEGQGLDLHLSKKLTRKLGGIMTYSIMESTRRDTLSGISYPFAFDQTHQFNFLVNYKVNSRLMVSMKYRYATGKPSDTYIIHANVLNDVNRYRYAKEIVGINASRLPDFHSLDFRVNYDFSFRHIALTMFMDVVNVVNRQIPNFENFNGYNGRAYYDGLAIFPTGGLKFEF